MLQIQVGDYVALKHGGSAGNFLPGQRLVVEAVIPPVAPTQCRHCQGAGSVDTEPGMPDLVCGACKGNGHNNDAIPKHYQINGIPYPADQFVLMERPSESAAMLTREKAFADIMRMQTKTGELMAQFAITGGEVVDGVLKS